MNRFKFDFCVQVEAQFEKTTTEEVEVAEESTLSSIYLFNVHYMFINCCFSLEVRGHQN